MKLLKLLPIFLFAFTLNLSTTSNAEENNWHKTKESIKSIESKKNEELEKESKSIVEEALRGAMLTQQAYHFLDQNNIEDAKKTIMKAISAIDSAISNNEGVELLPLNVNVIARMGEYDLPSVIKIKNDTIKSLKSGNIQAARSLLDPLVDEIDVEIAYLPINIYKEKLNTALGLLENNKKWESRESLREALSLAIINTEIIPIPLIEAEDLLNEAISIKNKNKTKALNLLEEATEAIKLSNALGYTPEYNNNVLKRIHNENKSFSNFKHKELRKNILKEINNLESVVKNSTIEIEKKLYDKIKETKQILNLEK